MATLKVKRPTTEPPPVVNNPQTPPAQPSPVSPEPLEIKRSGGRKLWMAGIGAALVVLGFGAFVFVGAHPDAMYLGVPGVFAILGGGFLVYTGFKKQEESIIFVTASGKDSNAKAAAIKANCLNIYPDRVEFAEIPPEQRQGMPRRCRRDNKYYFVHIWDSAWGNKNPQNKLVPFKLPDTQYRDPRVFALNLRLPAHRELVKRRASLFEKLSPIFLVIGLVIASIVLIIAMSPPPQTGG